MRARDVVGRRIVAVEHSRWWNEHLRRLETTCVRLVLDDGSVIWPDAFESLDAPVGDLIHFRRSPSPGAPTPEKGAPPNE